MQVKNSLINPRFCWKNYSKYATIILRTMGNLLSKHFNPAHCKIYVMSLIVANVIIDISTSLLIRFISTKPWPTMLKMKIDILLNAYSKPFKRHRRWNKLNSSLPIDLWLDTKIADAVQITGKQDIVKINWELQQSQKQPTIDRD